MIEAAGGSPLVGRRRWRPPSRRSTCGGSPGWRRCPGSGWHGSADRFTAASGWLCGVAADSSGLPCCTGFGCPTRRRRSAGLSSPPTWQASCPSGWRRRGGLSAMPGCRLPLRHRWPGSAQSTCVAGSWAASPWAACVTRRCTGSPCYRQLIFLGRSASAAW